MKLIDRDSRPTTRGLGGSPLASVHGPLLVLVLLVTLLLPSGGCSLVVVAHPTAAQEIATDPQCDPDQWLLPFVADYAIAALIAGLAVYLPWQRPIDTFNRRIGVLVGGVAIAGTLAYSAEEGRSRGRQCEKKSARWKKARAMGTRQFIEAEMEAKERRGRECERLKKAIANEYDFSVRTKLVSDWVARCEAER